MSSFLIILSLVVVVDYNPLCNCETHCHNRPTPHRLQISKFQKLWRTSDRYNRDQSNDRYNGDQSNDRYNRDQSNDRYNGDQSNDRYNGDQSSDRYNGDQSNDRYNGDQSNDRYNGDQSSDRYNGDQSNDRYNGDQSSDTEVREQQQNKVQSDFKYFLSFMRTQQFPLVSSDKTCGLTRYICPTLSV